MVDRVPIDRCVLCNACSDICPMNAIDYKAEDHTFLYPVIDRKSCVNCKLCESVCPAILPPAAVRTDGPMAFAAKSKCDDNRISSTSGGVFWEAAHYIISLGGYVCGAVFDDHYHVRHIISNNVHDISQMRGSKYAQSNMKGLFSQIQKHLKNSRPVLFCGCPCQVKAVREYCKDDCINLFLFEVVCHGTPSDSMLQSYISMMEKKYHGRLSSLSFRDKTYGWHMSSVRMQFDNGKVYMKPITADAYMKGFLNGSTQKESCYCCKFKNGASGCDVMLGDLWGAEQELPEVDDNKGLSAVLVFSEKGFRLLNALPIETYQVDPEHVIKHNQNIIKATGKNPVRESFFRFAEAQGMESAINRFFAESNYDELKRVARYRLRCAYHRMKGDKKPLY